jgi:hypothetical protein
MGCAREEAKRFEEVNADVGGFKLLVGFVHCVYHKRSWATWS